MSTGRTHKKASVILATGFSLAAIVYDTNLFICSVGALFGIICSPDQDCDNGNISNFIVRKNVGWFGERLWRWFWRGYSSSFKHGQFASHFPIFGTFVRLFYIYFFIILIPSYFLKFLEFLILDSEKFTNLNLTYFLTWCATLFLNPYFFSGLAGSDLIHYFLDKLTKNVER